MCDCEEMEFEDFEAALAAAYKKPVAQVEEAPAPVPQVVVARKRK